MQNLTNAFKLRPDQDQKGDLPRTPSRKLPENPSDTAYEDILNSIKTAT